MGNQLLRMMTMSDWKMVVWPSQQSGYMAQKKNDTIAIAIHNEINIWRQTLLFLLITYFSLLS